LVFRVLTSRAVTKCQARPAVKNPAIPSAARGPISFFGSASGGPARTGGEKRG